MLGDPGLTGHALGMLLRLCGPNQAPIPSQHPQKVSSGGAGSCAHRPGWLRPHWELGALDPLCPQAMKKIYKAGLKYPEWKRKHDPGYKPWVYPEQNTLPSVSLAELSVQHADSLENIDETGLPEDHLSTSDHEA